MYMYTPKLMCVCHKIYWEQCSISDYITFFSLQLLIPLIIIFYLSWFSIHGCVLTAIYYLFYACNMQQFYI